MTMNRPWNRNSSPSTCQPYFSANQYGLSKFFRVSERGNFYLNNQKSSKHIYYRNWMFFNIVMSFCPFSVFVWLQRFSTIQYGLNKLCRMSTKENFYHIVFTSEKKNFKLLANIKFTSLNNFEKGPKTEHSCDVKIKIGPVVQKELSFEGKT